VDGSEAWPTTAFGRPSTAGAFIRESGLIMLVEGGGGTGERRGKTMRRGVKRENGVFFQTIERNRARESPTTVERSMNTTPFGLSFRTCFLRARGKGAFAIPPLGS